MIHGKLLVHWDWAAGDDRTVRAIYLRKENGEWMMVNTANVSDTQASATRDNVIGQLTRMNTTLDALVTLWDNAASNDNILAMCRYLCEDNAILLASLTHIVLELSDKQNPDRYNGVR